MIGVHILGLHAADLIQECSNAVAAGTTVRELSMMVSMLYVCSVSGFRKKIKYVRAGSSK